MFVGSVTKLTVASATQQQILKKELLVHFFVEEPFKGVTVGEVEIATATGTDCDLNFTVGKRYFVYAYQAPQTKRLSTGACTRTKELAAAKEDIEEMHELSTLGHRTWLMGTDAKPTSLLEGAEVIVEGQGKRFVTSANKQGDFRIRLPGAGTYLVTIVAPVGVKLLNHLVQWRVFETNGQNAVEFTRSIAEGECDFLDLSRMLTAKKSTTD